MMVFLVVLLTKPTHVERAAIIVMVRVRFRRPAFLAGLLQQKSFSEGQSYSPSRRLTLLVGGLAKVGFFVKAAPRAVLRIGQIAP